MPEIINAYLRENVMAVTLLLMGNRSATVSLPCLMAMIKQSNATKKELT